MHRSFCGNISHELMKYGITNFLNEIYCHKNDNGGHVEIVRVIGVCKMRS